VRVLGLGNQDLVHLADLVVVGDLGSDMLALPAPVVPVNLAVDEGLRVVLDPVKHAAVRSDGRALAATALALEEQVALAHVPGLPANAGLEAVFANELVACLVEVLEALEDIGAEKSSLVVYYGPLTVMTLFGAEFHVEWNQGVRVRDQVLASHQGRRRIDHSAHVEQL